MKNYTQKWKELNKKEEKSKREAVKKERENVEQ